MESERGADGRPRLGVSGRFGVTLWVAVLLLMTVSLGGCRRAAFALLPQAPMGPQHNADPFAPLGPPADARAPEGQAPTLSTGSGKIDVGVSAASVLATFLGGSSLLFGIYGNFEETAVVAPERDPARKRAASPAASQPAPAAPQPAPAGGSAPAPDERH